MMADQRPDPDALLRRVQAEAQRETGGKLKLFFGASAGVGKTYAMLEAAHVRLAEGVDVVVGYVETHRRAETEALVEGLEILPRRQLMYHGVTVEEFDLDSALARHPALILVDELAHSNEEGSRHTKRWQDVAELLDAGISVYTAVNVQHLESLNDLVAQITNIVVRETVPDSFLERADEVELIDLTPDDLLQRLKEGKVYVPHQAERAAQNFFRKGNLIALRELALRRTADRVDAQMQTYKRSNAIARPWPTMERLLVCVGPGAFGPRLVRAARRMAERLRAEWLVVYVETPKQLRLSEAMRADVVQTLRLAEQLGAETVTLSGQHVTEEVVSYARTRNVSTIVVGKPARARWREIAFGSVVNELVRHSGAIDVYVLTGDAGEDTLPRATLPVISSHRRAYAWAVVVVAICTVVAKIAFPYLDPSNLIMVYLAGIVVVASRNGRGPATLASLLSVAAFDFFFVQPYLSFAVSDLQYLITFGVMLLVALVISTLTARLRQQADAARSRERRTAALYALSRELASVRGLKQLLHIVVQHVNQVFDTQVVVLLPNTLGQLQTWGTASGWWGEGVEGHMVFAPSAADTGVAQWVYDHQRAAGVGTDTLPGAEALYIPLSAANGTVGVLGVRQGKPQTLFTPDQMHLLEAFASQTTLAVERAQLVGEHT